jgi:DNA-directed RNA polymerase specialized sigma24 family protein
MSSDDTTKRQTRYYEVQDCTWRDEGQCVHSHCRYSLLQDRPHISEWNEQDLRELVEALPSTCALDLAELGGMRLEEVAVVMGLPRPRVEQLEIAALRKLAKSREVRKARWDGR